MMDGFGAELRRWRRLRRLSQLDLAGDAGVSARHLSFLEQGHSRPSREMVLQLAETLEVPREARNALLTAAGFAAVYTQRPAGHPDLAPLQAAVTRMIERHAPYPAMAMDRHWRVVEANPAARGMLSAVGLSVGASLLEAFVGPGPLRSAILNWPQAARHTLIRLRTEIAHLGADAVLEAAAQRLAADPHLGPPEERAPAVTPYRYRVGSARLSFFSTIAQFGTVDDLALADLRVELMFPSDQATEAFFSREG